VDYLGSDPSSYSIYAEYRAENGGIGMVILWTCIPMLKKDTWTHREEYMRSGCGRTPFELRVTFLTSSIGKYSVGVDDVPAYAASIITDNYLRCSIEWDISAQIRRDSFDKLVLICGKKGRKVESSRS
jgi:hypothetical protein